MLLNFLFFIIAVIIIVFIVKHIRDLRWHRKPLRNFSFTHHGKEFWYSRSVAVTHFVFAKDINGVLRVLANKRGKGTPDFVGSWNCPCGYLDFDESGEDAAQRETYEETNVFVPKNKITLFGVNTSPNQNRQNVSIRYISVLDEQCENFTLNNDNSEEDEVSEIKWISLAEIDNYSWAFGHDEILKEIFNKIKE